MNPLTGPCDFSSVNATKAGPYFTVIHSVLMYGFTKLSPAGPVQTSSTLSKDVKACCIIPRYNIPLQVSTIRQWPGGKKVFFRGVKVGV